MTKNPDKSRCYATVNSGDYRSPHFRQCSHKWLYRRGGARYCKAHDPVAIEARRAKRPPTKFERSMDRIERTHDVFEAARAVAAIEFHPSGPDSPMSDFVAKIVALREALERCGVR